MRNQEEIEYINQALKRINDADDERMRHLWHIEHVHGLGEESVCPVCSRPLIMRNGEAVCVSGMCRWRVVETCCGD